MNSVESTLLITYDGVNENCVSTTLPWTNNVNRPENTPIQFHIVNQLITSAIVQRWISHTFILPQQKKKRKEKKNRKSFPFCLHSSVFV